MDTTLDTAIREHIFRYLTGEIDLPAFEDWFVGATWEVLGHAEGPLLALVGDVDLALAEYSSGHATIIDLRRDLGDAMQNVTVAVGAPQDATAASGTTISQRVELPSAQFVSRSVVASL